MLSTQDSPPFVASRTCSTNAIEHNDRARSRRAVRFNDAVWSITTRDQVPGHRALEHKSDSLETMFHVERNSPKNRFLYFEHFDVFVACVKAMVSTHKRFDKPSYVVPKSLKIEMRIRIHKDLLLLAKVMLVETRYEYR